MPTIYKNNEYFFYFEDTQMGKKIRFGILFCFSITGKYWRSETRKDLPREPLRAAGLSAICCLLIEVIWMWYEVSFKKYGSEVDEAWDCGELISGVQIYFDLGLD